LLYSHYTVFSPAIQQRWALKIIARQEKTESGCEWNREWEKFGAIFGVMMEKVDFRGF